MKADKTFLIYALTFVTAASSILYELLIAQTITSLAAETVLWYSVTMGLYLLSMGCGALVYARVFPAGTACWPALGKLELGLSALGAGIVFLLNFGHMCMSYLWARGQFHEGSVVFFAIAFFISFLVGFLSGLELPLLIAAAREASPDKPVVNRVLGADYFGSLAGAVIFPLVLLPHFELSAIGAIIAGVNLFIVMAIVLPQGKSPAWVKLAAPLVLALCALCLSQTRGVTQYFLKKYYYYSTEAADFKKLILPPRGLPDIDHTLTPYQDIDLVKAPENPDPFYYLPFAYSNKYKRVTREYPIDYLFYVSRSFQFWLNFEELYHEYYVHVPIQYFRSVPRRVLVLGGGDGLLLRELLKYPGVERVTLVDIDAKVVEMARAHEVLRKINHNAFADARVTAVIADAYQFVRQDKGRYDAVFMDFPDPANYDLSKLYSREFYAFVLKRLANSGFAVVNVPRMGEKKAEAGHEMRVIYSTLHSAGYGFIKPYVTKLETDNPEAEDLLDRLLGGAEEIVARATSAASGEETEEIIKGKDAIFTRIMSDFSGDYQQQFIMAARQPVPGRILFTESAIEMDVLNAERFALALADMGLAYAPGQVNSIMKPVLPKLEYWWRLKLPY